MNSPSKEGKKEKKKEIEALLQEVIDLTTLANLEELEIQEGKRKIRIKKKIIKLEKELATEIQEEEPSLDIDKYKKVISPLTGIFYRAPAAEDEPYVEEGDIIEKGKTLCLIEAMKLFNEIKSEVDGKIFKIMVKNGSQVAEGQILFLVEPIE